MCVCVCARARALLCAAEVRRAGVPSSREPPGMEAGNRTLVGEEGICILNCRAISIVHGKACTYVSPLKSGGEL